MNQDRLDSDRDVRIVQQLACLWLGRYDQTGSDEKRIRESFPDLDFDELNLDPLDPDYKSTCILIHNYLPDLTDQSDFFSSVLLSSIFGAEWDSELIDEILDSLATDPYATIDLAKYDITLD